MKLLSAVGLLASCILLFSPVLHAQEKFESSAKIGATDCENGKLDVGFSGPGGFQPDVDVTNENFLVWQVDGPAIGNLANDAYITFGGDSPCAEPDPVYAYQEYFGKPKNNVKCTIHVPVDGISAPYAKTFTYTVHSKTCPGEFTGHVHYFLK